MDISGQQFDNYLVVVPKIKVILMLSKPVSVGMCMLDLICKFHYEYIENIYVNKSRLFNDTVILLSQSIMIQAN